MAGSSLTTAEASSSAAEKKDAGLHYVSKPANAAQIEATLGTPSTQVGYARVNRLVEGGEQAAVVKPGSRVELSMPDGTSFPVVIQTAEALGDGRYVSQGTLEGREGNVVFAVADGELSATIDSLEAGSYQIRALGDSVAQVFKVDPALVPPCGTDHMDTATLSAAASAAGTLDAAGALEAAGDREVAGGTTTSSTVFAPGASSTPKATQTVRILVPYSTKILNTVSSSAVKSGIDLSIATLNTDLARSAIPLKVVLAGAPSVAYSQDGSESSGVAVDRALSRITSYTDKILDTIHCQRYDAKADLVCFLISQVDSTNSGVGYVLETPLDAFNSTYGFSAITYGYLNSSRTFSHEVGHNLGCAHDRQNAKSTDGGSAKGTFAYSYGYRFYGKNNVQYRTIMAYSPGQVAAYFSNPNVTLPSPVSVKAGVTIGSSTQAANAQTIIKNEAEVAAYHNNRLISRVSKSIRGY